MIITNFEQLLPFKKKSGIYLFTLKKDTSKNYAGKAYKRLYRRIAIEHAQSRTKQYIDYTIKDLGGLLENFIIELVHWWDEPVDNIEVLAYEVAVIDEYNCLKEKGGYNILLFNFDRTGTKMSKNAKEKLRIINTGKRHSIESIEKMKQNAIGKNNGFYSKKHSNKTKLQISESRKGKKFTKEHCRKISETNKNQDNSFLKKPIKQIDLDGNLIKLWESTIDAAKFLNKNANNINSVLRKISKTAYGYKWEYA